MKKIFDIGNFEKLPRKRGCLEKQPSQVRIVIIDLGKLVQSTVSFKYIPPSGRSQVFPDFELEFAIQPTRESLVRFRVSDSLVTLEHVP